MVFSSLHGRGVRQGFPLSPCLFILCADILADAIRKYSEIKGLTVNRREIKISQYADDSTLILDGHQRSLATSLKLLDLFSEISGLRLNQKITKSSVDWCKCRQWGKAETDPSKWITDKVKTLGVWLSTDPQLMMKANYQDKFTKIKASLGCWELRRLGLRGKITVLKSLIIYQSPLLTDHGEVNENFCRVARG